MQNELSFTGTMPPTIQEVKIYFSQKGIPYLEADHFFLFYEKKGWKNKKGQPLKSWKNIARSWIMSVLSTKPWLFNRNIH